MAEAKELFKGARADILVGLHDLVADAIPKRFAPKVRVIHQSAVALPGRTPMITPPYFFILSAISMGLKVRAV